MIILGVDPGSGVTAVTRLRASFDGVLRLSFLDTDVVENELLAVWVRDARFDVMGLERPRGYAFGAGKGPGVVAHLLDAGYAAGVAAAAYTLTRDMRYGFREFPCSEWRQWVIGKANAGDPEVGLAIPRLIEGWPERSNNHARDAAGAALYVARTVALPLLRKAAS